eukprot:jgi/Psemu1/44252/gm1.44252_g
MSLNGTQETSLKQYAKVAKLSANLTKAKEEDINNRGELECDKELDKETCYTFWKHTLVLARANEFKRLIEDNKKTKRVLKQPSFVFNNVMRSFAAGFFFKVDMTTRFKDRQSKAIKVHIAKYVKVWWSGGANRDNPIFWKLHLLMYYSVLNFIDMNAKTRGQEALTQLISLLITTSVSAIQVTPDGDGYYITITIKLVMTLQSKNLFAFDTDESTVLDQKKDDSTTSQDNDNLWE